MTLNRRIGRTVIIIDRDGFTISGPRHAIDWYWHDTYRPIRRPWGRITRRRTRP